MLPLSTTFARAVAGDETTPDTGTTEGVEV